MDALFKQRQPRCHQIRSYYSRSINYSVRSTLATSLTSLLNDRLGRVYTNTKRVAESGILLQVPTPSFDIYQGLTLRQYPIHRALPWI